VYANFVRMNNHPLMYTRLGSVIQKPVEHIQLNHDGYHRPSGHFDMKPGVQSHNIEHYNPWANEDALDYEKPDWYKGSISKNQNIKSIEIIGKTQNFPPDYKIRIIMKDGPPYEPDTMDASEVVAIFKMNGIEPPIEVQRISDTLKTSQADGISWF